MVEGNAASHRHRPRIWLSQNPVLGGGINDQCIFHKVGIYENWWPLRIYIYIELYKYSYIYLKSNIYIYI